MGFGQAHEGLRRRRLALWRSAVFLYEVVHGLGYGVCEVLSYDDIR